MGRAHKMNKKSMLLLLRKTDVLLTKKCIPPPPAPPSPRDTQRKSPSKLFGSRCLTFTTLLLRLRLVLVVRIPPPVKSCFVVYFKNFNFGASYVGARRVLYTQHSASMAGGDDHPTPTSPSPSPLALPQHVDRTKLQHGTPTPPPQITRHHRRRAKGRGPAEYVCPTRLTTKNRPQRQGRAYFIP